MSSKQPVTINLSPAMIANIRATMMNMESMTVNWAGVKEATGVTTNGNAAQGFRNAMKAFGLKVVDTKNWTFGDVNDAAAGPSDPGAAAATATPAKKRGRPKKDNSSPEAKRKKKTTPKKEQLSEDEIKQEDEAAEVAKAAEIAKAVEEAMAEDGFGGEEN